MFNDSEWGNLRSSIIGCMAGKGQVGIIANKCIIKFAFVLCIIQQGNYEEIYLLGLHNRIRFSEKDAVREIIVWKSAYSIIGCMASKGRVLVS